MENYYLLDYLKCNSQLTPKRYDNLRYELDNHLHYYGDHFKFPHETHGKKNEILIRTYIKYLFILFKIIQNRKSNTIGEIILSNAYFSINNELNKNNEQILAISKYYTTNKGVDPFAERIEQFQNIVI